MFQLLGAAHTSIYSEFQGRQRVLPEALGGTVQSHQAEAAGKASQTETLGLKVQALIPSGTTLSICGISGHPLLAGQGLGQRELPVPLGILLLMLLLSLPFLAGERERNESGIVWVTAALTQLFTFKILIKNIKGISCYT